MQHLDLCAGLGDDQTDFFAIMQEAFDDHESDEGLAQADAVAQEGAAELVGDLHQRPVPVFLVLTENGVHVGTILGWPGFFPFAGRHFVAFEVFLQCPGINLEGGVFTDMAFDRVQDSGVTSSAAAQCSS